MLYWSIDNREWSIYIKCNRLIDLLPYYDNPTKRSPDPYIQSDQIYTWATNDELSMDRCKRVVDGLKQYQSEMQDGEIIYPLMGLAQSVEYIPDVNNAGNFKHTYEFVQRPLELLIDPRGDCEDSALLLATLLNEAGYDAKMVQLPGHMAVGVNRHQIPNYDESIHAPIMHTSAGGDYILIDTTYTQDLGHWHWENKYRAEDAVFIPINAGKFADPEKPHNY